MTTLSNLYAEKVFAEHPIALWALDDQVDYVSIVNETNRNMSSWTKSAGTTITSFANETIILQTTPSLGFPSIIFDTSYTNQVFVPNITAGNEGTVTLTSSFTIQQSDINTKIQTLSVGTYVYPFDKSISFTVGITYLDANSTSQEQSKLFYIGDVRQWAYVSEMFLLPEVFTNLKVKFTATYSGPTTGYYFLLNGISVGQLSEQFNVESLGVIPTDINTQESYPVFETVTTGVKADAYGLQSKNAYYLTDTDNTLCAINSGMPLVFGASSSTQITPNDNNMPSLIIPAYGLLSDEGQHKDLTLEFWIRIQSKTTSPLRIVGPIDSEDGIYVNDSFMILKIGSKSGTYYINEWDRPMLLSLRYSDETVSLTINGEEVISLDILGISLSFPQKYQTISEITYNKDWIGFYGYEDVPMIEIDCVGVYPYIVPSIMEKRRWVYGQGIGNPPGVSSIELASSVAVDYTVSNYTKNYSYPDLGRWQQGINENLAIDNQTISLPSYELPTIFFDNRTIDEWYEDVPKIETLFDKSICLRPSSDAASYDWSSTNGYILFPTINLLNQDTKAFYALFESDATNTDKQILLSIENEVTKEVIEVTLDESVVNYTLKYMNPDGTISEELLHTNDGPTEQHVPGQFLLAGIEISKFVAAFGNRVASIFGTKQQLKLYVGGNKDLGNTFTGKIYRVGFCTARNLQKISNAFTTQGIAVAYNALENDYVYDAQGFSGSNPTTVTDYTNAHVADGGDSYFGNLNTVYEEIVDGGSVYSILVDRILSHIASYTLTPKVFLGNFILDIATNGYWQDYLPLSYFGKYVNDGSNNKYYDLDFLQYNISYPAIKKYINYKYDTSNSVVKTYISFDYLKNTPTIDPGYFSVVVAAGNNNVIEPDSNWYKRLYEITDNTIIYPPPGVDFNTISIVLHIEILSNGIIEHPVKIQSAQLSSKSLNAFVPNPVGTKYGADVYPYRKSGGYFDYKGRNPFSIYKSSMPYLYLTGNSGFRIHDLDNITIERGISVPINKNVAQFYKLSGMQFNARYSGELFPDGITEILHMQSNESYIRIYMERDSDNGQRAKLYAIDGATGLPQDGVMFYINGRKVSTPIININTWHMIGLVFNVPVDFSNNIGAIRFTGPLMWNNLFVYESSEADEASRSVYRKWFTIKTLNETDKDWQYWKNLETTPGSPFAWRDVLFISSENFDALDGKLVYQKYTGTDRIIIDTDNTFRLKNYYYAVYSDIVWQTSTVSPV